MHTIHLANAKAVEYAQRVVSSPDFRNWYVKLVQHPQRTVEQNALMWPILQELSNNLKWPLWTPKGWREGRMQDNEWKDFLTASFRRETGTIAQGYDREGYVIVGTGTSDMDKPTFSEFLEFIIAFAAQQGVVLHLPGRL